MEVRVTGCFLPDKGNIMKLVCFGFLVVLGYLFGTIVMALEGARAVLSALFNFPDFFSDGD